MIRETSSRTCGLYTVHGCSQRAGGRTLNPATFKHELEEGGRMAVNRSDPHHGNIAWINFLQRLEEVLEDAAVALLGVTCHDNLPVLLGASCLNPWGGVHPDMLQEVVHEDPLAAAAEEVPQLEVLTTQRSQYVLPQGENCGRSLRQQRSVLRASGHGSRKQ